MTEPKPPSRYLLLIPLAGLLLLLGLIFRQAVMTNVIEPLATVAWLLLRILVLSIDQEVYWWGLIFVVVLGAMLLPLRGPKTEEIPTLMDANPSMERVSYWRSSILANLRTTLDRSTIQRELIWLLSSHFASRQPGAVKVSNYEIREALKQKRIALPEDLYGFLFANEDIEEPPGFFKDPLGSLRRRAHSIRMAPQKWTRHWSGQDTAEYYQRIGEALALIETSLEMTHDDDPFNPPDD
jgi:hypothetical protein